MKKIKIGIVGCGTIGSALAKKIVSEFSQVATLSYICDFHREKMTRLIRDISYTIKPASITTLIQESDFVIEAASPLAAREVVQKALLKNKSAFILSVGGLLSFKGFNKLMKKSSGRIWIPSGAIAGIDGLLAAREAGIRKVSLKMFKPPAALREAPYFKSRKFPVLSKNQMRCVFRGNATGAVRGFPMNVNVAALLSLAGVGPSGTQVEIWTSKKFRRNQHCIQVDAHSGSLRYEVSNVPSRLNPKTSALAVFSAIATLRKIFGTLKLGT